MLVYLTQHYINIEMITILIMSIKIISYVIPDNDISYSLLDKYIYLYI